MSNTIGSKEYNEWLNSPLTKALKRSFEQSITDPENQPSQYGTVTLAMYEHLEEQITASQQRVAELEKERDKAHQYWQIAEGRCDALMKQRDDLVTALEKLTDVFANIGITSGLYDDEQDALKAACDVIASVKEK